MINSKHIVCPVCKTDFAHTQAREVGYPRKAAHQKETQGFKTISFCPGCEVGIALPLMSDAQLDSLYEEGDYWQDKRLKVFLPRDYPGAWANAAARWQFVKQSLHLPPGASLSVLDIGGGHGFFGMAIARDKGVRLDRYDIVEKDKFFRGSLKLTWQKLYPRVPFAVWSDLREVNARYQIVVLSHILEHVNDPRHLLRIASDRLNPGGYVLTDVPCQDYLFKSDVFPHVIFFQPSNLSLLCRNAGLDPVATDCFGISQKSAKDRWVSNGYTLFLEHLVYHTKGIFPVGLSKLLYDRLFKPGTPNPQGIWIRALVKKPW